MTVRINKDALNLREELTKAQGVVRYEQRQFWMDGLVENGTFDTADGWVLGSGDSIANGQLTIGTTTSFITQPFYFVKGKTYMATVDVIADDFRDVRFPYDGKVENIEHVPESVGTHSFTFVSGGSTTLFFGYALTANDAVFDNIQVFEVDENDNVIHSVPLGFKPVHVYEDGLLQREGENHDYTVVDTGFEYQIKPTVAPTGATETCVIAEREL